MVDTFLWEAAAKGRADGIAEGEANSVIKVLLARFGNVPNSVRSAVLAVADVEKLDDLLGKAALVSSVEEFEKALS